MLFSMTGFGAGSITQDDHTVQVEIRSLNSKFLELGMKLPASDASLENDIRNEITRELQRGKVSVIVQWDSPLQAAMQPNTEMMQHYFRELEGIRKKLGIKSKIKLSELLNLPGVWQSSSDDMQILFRELVMKALKEAISNMMDNRKSEGHVLEKDILHRCKLIEDYLRSVAAFEEGRITNVRNRLKAQLAEFLDAEKANHDRFEQELIYYMEKMDVTEEKIRLQTHIDYFRKTIETEEGTGKKLNFITQEMGREINTLGSKANDASIQKLVISMKDELEKIKEQTANIV
jgi:uncharacterized protein (TIGR00255 family)